MRGCFYHTDLRKEFSISQSTQVDILQTQTLSQPHIFA